MLVGESGVLMRARLARQRSWLRVLVWFALRMLKAKLRSRANTPGLVRMASAARAAVTGVFAT